jgi:hypothetical protein
MIENLTSDTYVLYAMKSYDMPNYILSEFKEDMKRFNYLKRLFLRYRKCGEIRERLILNHLVIIYNLFGTEASTRLLFYKIDPRDYGTLKTYLIFLNFMPEIIRGIRNRNILSCDIEVDSDILEKLREIK